jgi:hypothetical protein
MWSWMPLKPSLRSAYPLIGSAASAEGVMSTFAAPATNVPLSAAAVSRSDVPIKRIARMSPTGIVMFVPPNRQPITLFSPGWREGTVVEPNKSPGTNPGLGTARRNLGNRNRFSLTCLKRHLNQSKRARSSSRAEQWALAAR